MTGSEVKIEQLRMYLTPMEKKVSCTRKISALQTCGSQLLLKQRQVKVYRAVLT
jgi:hypothetical protein